MNDSRKTISKNKKYFQQRNKKKFFLEPGIKGFFCTCNFREKDCIRECYNILNEYADKIPGGDGSGDASEAKEKDEPEKVEVTDDVDVKEDDISDQLKKELDTMKGDASKDISKRRFQAVETGATNCIFIRSSIPDPNALATEILEDLSKTKVQKTRYLLRLIPIQATCRANIKDITDTAGQLFDKTFLKEPTTFSIVFNRRYNNSINRDDVIKELADSITLKNPANKADLKKPALAVIVEIIKGICLLSVVPKYYEYRKYNLFEVSKDEEQPENTEINKPE